MGSLRMSGAELSVELELEVPFYDLDPLDIVWHGNYFKYFDRAREKLLSLVNYDYREMRKSGFSWPVVQCECRYYKPLVYGQRIKVRALLQEYELLLKIAYVITDAATGQKMSKGETTQVAVDVATGETCMGSPEIFLERIRRRLCGG